MINIDPIKAAIAVFLIALLVLAGVQCKRYGDNRHAEGKAEVQAKWDKAVERGRIRVEELRAAAGRVTVKTETVYVDRIKTIREKGDAIIREVPVFVPADSGELPGGFRLLHDAAAAGTVPDPAGIADAAAVPAQTAASTIAGNYLTFHETRQQLVSLQAWVLAQCKANPPPEGCSP
jgi:Tfp pilus assembly protein PilV